MFEKAAEQISQDPLILKTPHVVLSTPLFRAGSVRERDHFVGSLTLRFGQGCPDIAITARGTGTRYR